MESAYMQMSIFCMGNFYIKENQEKFMFWNGEPAFKLENSYHLTNLFWLVKITNISKKRNYYLSSCFMHYFLSTVRISIQWINTI